MICLSKPTPKKSYYACHLAALLIPLFATLLPLSTCTVGPSNDDGEAGWCYISPGDNDLAPWVFTFWIFASFYFWIWCTVVYMMYHVLHLQL